MPLVRIFMVASWVLSVQSPAHTACLPQGELQIEVLPACPSSADSLTVRIWGYFPDGCWSEPRFDSLSLEAGALKIYSSVPYGDPLDTSTTIACPLVIIPFDLRVPVGRLAPGRYDIQFVLSIVSRIFGGTAVCTSAFSVGDAASFRAGDVNRDGRTTAADLVLLVNYVFKDGSLPCGVTGDLDCDGASTAADLIRLVGYLFRSASEPACP